MPFRYKVVEASQGASEADEWLLVTYRIYRTGLYGKSLGTSWMRTREYRPLFLKSTLGLRRLLSEKGLLK